MTSAPAHPDRPAARTPSPWLVLGAALVGISFAAPLIRLSAADPLVIATWRLGFSLIIVAAALAIGGGWRGWRTLSRAELGLACGAGALLALHFWSWNASLRYTTVAASVALVNLQPVIIAAASAWLLAEPPSRRQWVGGGVAVSGASRVRTSVLPPGASKVRIGRPASWVTAITALRSAITPAQRLNQPHLIMIEHSSQAQLSSGVA